MEITVDLKLLEGKLKRLKLDYEKYFAGVLEREPVDLLKDVEHLVRLYSRGLIQNTYLRFKFNSLTASFGSYRQLWNRMLREKEQKDLERKEPREVLEYKDIPIEENKLQSIYIELLKARKACNQPVDNITYKGMLKVLADRVKKFKEDHTVTSVDIRVDIKDGRTKMVIIPEKS